MNDDIAKRLADLVTQPPKPHEHEWKPRGAGGGQGVREDHYFCGCGATKTVTIKTPKQEWIVNSAAQILYSRRHPHKHFTYNTRGDVPDQRQHGHRGYGGNITTYNGPYRRHCVDNMPQTWGRRSGDQRP